MTRAWLRRLARGLPYLFCVYWAASEYWFRASWWAVSLQWLTIALCYGLIFSGQADLAAERRKREQAERVNVDLLKFLDSAAAEDGETGAPS